MQIWILRSLPAICSIKNWNRAAIEVPRVMNVKFQRSASSVDTNQEHIYFILCGVLSYTKLSPLFLFFVLY